jgi:hypothetical protein
MSFSPLRIFIFTFFNFYFNFYLSLIVIIKQVSSKGLEEVVVILAESVALFWFVSFVSNRNVNVFTKNYSLIIK